MSYNNFHQPRNGSQQILLDGIGSIMLASIIVGAGLVDNYSSRRDVLYLVQNGIEPAQAAQRVVNTQRTIKVIAMLVSPFILFGSMFILGGIVGVIFSFFNASVIGLVQSLAVIIGVGVPFIWSSLSALSYPWRRIACKGLPESNIPLWRLRPRSSLTIQGPGSEAVSLRTDTIQLIIGFTLISLPFIIPALIVLALFIFTEP